VIDKGVFHNDVIAVSNQQVLFCHEQAFVDQPQLLQQLAQQVPGFTPLVVPASQVSVERRWRPICSTASC
jgi:succinylarginine dihydrolase